MHPTISLDEKCGRDKSLMASPNSSAGDMAVTLPLAVVYLLKVGRDGTVI